MVHGGHHPLGCHQQKVHAVHREHQLGRAGKVIRGDSRRAGGGGGEGLGLEMGAGMMAVLGGVR